MVIKISNDTTSTSSISCYWLCNRKAELKVYTDFGNILHLCKKCYEVYDPAHRLKAETI
jgi:hypothetical protein